MGKFLNVANNSSRAHRDPQKLVCINYCCLHVSAQAMNFLLGQRQSLPLYFAFDNDKASVIS